MTDRWEKPCWNCEQCGARCPQVHETTVCRVRDLPLFEYRVVLHVPRRRVVCERCGWPRLQKLDWLGRYQRITQRCIDPAEPAQVRPLM